MTEEASNTSTPTPSPQPEALRKKCPHIRRKGRDRGRELLIVLGVIVKAVAILNL